MAQTSSKRQAALGSPQSIIPLLVSEAKDANSLNGVRAYAADLTKLLVPSNKVGKAYTKALSQRLAAADLMARQGKHKWVPESAVVQAFNDLMSKTTPRSATVPQTDAPTVHQLRLSLHSMSPFLSSVNSNETECLPSEAVFLVWLLVFNNGAAGKPLPGPLQGSPSSKSGYVMASFPNGPDARALLSAYMSAHGHSEIVDLYECLAQTIDL